MPTVAGKPGVPGRGLGGIGTSGNENTHTKIGHADIAGRDINRYPGLRKGMQIKHRPSKKKTAIKNPKI
jgi:hypothetical protein